MNADANHDQKVKHKMCHAGVKFSRNLYIYLRKMLQLSLTVIELHIIEFPVFCNMICTFLYVIRVQSGWKNCSNLRWLRMAPILIARVTGNCGIQWTLQHMSAEWSGHGRVSWCCWPMGRAPYIHCTGTIIAADSVGVCVCRAVTSGHGRGPVGWFRPGTGASASLHGWEHEVKTIQLLCNGICDEWTFTIVGAPPWAITNLSKQPMAAASTARQLPIRHHDSLSRTAGMIAHSMDDSTSVNRRAKGMRR